MFFIVSTIVLALIVVFGLIFIFRHRVQEVSVSNPLFGKFLLKLNDREKVINLDQDQERILSHTTADEVWALNDLLRNKENGHVGRMNPVQKYKYLQMLKANLVKKEGEYVVPTDFGRQVLALAERIEL